MRALLSLAVAFSWTAVCEAGFLSRPETPHPAVVRIIAPEGNGFSLGSGTLVATSQEHGLVITNWHVVRDATGQIIVVFPDGFRSGATVLKTDRDWDLAALAIWRPEVQPVPLSAAAPQLGESLTIAGYGGGNYRTATGRCTQYLSPGRNLPFEMVELSAGARQGDSGGPIFNQRGELAGVLFGASFGRTSGSFSGRVRQFLMPLISDFQRLEPSEAMIAGGPGSAAASSPEPVQAPAPLALPPPPTEVTVAIAGVRPAAAPPPDETDFASRPGGLAEAADLTAPLEPTAPLSAPSPAGALPTAGPSVQLAPTAGPTRLDQIKNILAFIGGFSILFHAMRLFGAGQPPAKPSKR